MIPQIGSFLGRMKAEGKTPRIFMINTKYSILINIGLLPGETGRAAYAKFQKKGERGGAR